MAIGICIIVGFLLVQATGNLLPAQEIGHSKGDPGASFVYYDVRTLEANRILVALNNRGYLDRYLYKSRVSGAFWPRKEGFSIVFDHGPWIIGKLQNEPRLGLAMWGSSYSPGPIIDGQPGLVVRPEDSLRYRPYKITRGDDASSNKDYAEWPADLGAPVDGQGRPELKGDQMIWMVYNAADSTIPYWWREDKPFKHLTVEIQQTAFSHGSTDEDSSGLFANTVFFEWMIVNKETDTIDSAYVSLWTDIDFGGASNNPPAIDTLQQLGYCWYSTDFSMDFGPRPPAVGYVWLYGPVVPQQGDTAVFMGGKRPGFLNLPLTSFWGIWDDCIVDTSLYCPALSLEGAWNIARGLDQLGRPIIDPQTKEKTTFPYSGDPVSGTGWIFPRLGTGGGAGFNMFSGPFTLAPGDTQWVMIALVAAQGSDRFDSIVRLREVAQFLRSSTYENLTITSVRDEKESETPSRFELLQNYPNPFNPSTVIRYQLPRSSRVSLIVYDLLGQEIATLVDGEQSPGSYSVEFSGEKLPSGVYFYRLQAEPERMREKRGPAIDFNGMFTVMKKMLLMK